jgi:hypothetical protein
MAAPRRATPQRRNRAWITAGIVLVLSFVLMPFLVHRPIVPPPSTDRPATPPSGSSNGPSFTWIPGVLQGIGLIMLGAIIGVEITRRLARRGAALEVDASRMLLGSNEPGKLRGDVVEEIRLLIARSKEIDARLLGVTIVGMMEEYERAEASADRQTALLRAQELFEKLRAKLAPWYVRHRKELAAVPATMSAVLGCVKIALEVKKMLG